MKISKIKIKKKDDTSQFKSKISLFDFKKKQKERFKVFIRITKPQIPSAWSF